VPTAADVVELKTGQRVEGTLKQTTPASVSIDVGGRTITFTGDKVRAIYFGAAPAPTASAPSPVSEAMRSLKAVQSAVTGGISYRDDTPRVTDAQIVVDRFLELRDAATPDVREAVAMAMSFHVFAGTAWSARFERASWTIAGDPMIEKCPALRREVANKPYTGDPRKTSTAEWLSPSACR
jgi:hypothetical protein